MSENVIFIRHNFGKNKAEKGLSEKYKELIKFDED